LSFLHPGYFLALLGLIPLVAVYFLKVRPRRQSVTAFFLWEAVFDQKKNTALFNRLRELLSLLLMALALLAIVLALTAPEVSRDERKDLLLVIDNSASMSALDKGRVRLTAAKKTAADIIRGLNAHQQAALATVSMDVQYQSHFTTSPKTLMDALRRIDPSDCPFRTDALKTLNAGAVALDNCRVILISDGCNYHADPNTVIELVKIGADQENLGFVSCDLRMLQRKPLQLGLYYKLASSFDQEVSTDIILSHGPDKRIIKVIPVTVKPGINEAEIYTLAAGGPGQWRATLDLEDALEKDNSAFLALQPKRPVRVRVDSDHPFFLVNSVNAFARTSGDLIYAPDTADVTLANGLIPQAERAVIFGLKENSGWCGQVGPEVDDVLARIKLEDHPVLDDCDLDSIPFMGARDISPPDGSLVIVENAAHVPLIYRVQDQQRTALVVNMDMLESEFYYSAWFPILVYNAARHLMGRQDSLAAACAVGDSLPFPNNALGRDSTRVTVGDSNDVVQLSGSSYGPIRQAGFHTLKNAAGQWSVGANLFAVTETLLGSQDVTDTSQALNRGWPLSLILAMFAALLLLLECILYHRRKVG
jgi:hypothetical protein